jgi:2,3-bisphosphoglycerate-independent phosphoglycerate mutase
MNLHFHALLDLAAREGLRKVCLHVFPGRPRHAAEERRNLFAPPERKIEQTGVGHIASMIGRYYAMDRDRRWQRVKSAYDLLTLGRAEFMAENPQAGLEAAYARGETDEFVKATAILPPDGKPVKMEDGDSVIFLNFPLRPCAPAVAAVHRARFRRVRTRGHARAWPPTAR